jgi:hypothetical protein
MADSDENEQMFPKTRTEVLLEEIVRLLKEIEYHVRTKR